MRGLTLGRARRAGAAMVAVVMGVGIAVTSPSFTDSPIAVATDAVGRIALGTAHTCAIDQEDRIWCWGSNSAGQLGSATHAGLSRSLTPVRADDLPAGRRPVAIAAGATHTCVLADDATVWCWGGNGFGQIGGTDSRVNSPIQIGIEADTVRLFLGGQNTCILRGDNSLACLGRNMEGQLGGGTSDVNRHEVASPVAGIPSSFQVRDMGIGAAHMCAVSTTDEVWCWGAWADGKLGTSGTSNVSQPQRTATLQGSANTVSAGADHTCVGLSTSVTCFGNNSFGQLGFTANNTPNDAPTEASLGSIVVDVVAGDNFTCVRSASTAPACWGANASYQLGPGSADNTDRHVPTAVVGLDASVVDIAMGGQHACVVMGDGMVRCWGENNDGQLGLGDRTDRHTAVQVSVLNVIPTTTTTTTTPTTTTTTTTVAPSPGTLAPVNSSPPSGTGGTTTVPVVTVPGTVAVTKASVRLRRTRKITASKLAKSVGLAIPKTSKGKMRFSIVRGATRCRFAGTSVQAVRRGTCTVSVQLIPRKGKTVRRTVVITVFG